MAINRLWAGICLLGCVSLAFAQGNPREGEEKVAACSGCHGTDGNGSAPIFPKLAGQHASYIVKQLAEFKSLKRVEPTMNAMAEGLSEDDMADIGAYYSGLKTSIEEGAHNPAGEKIYKAGNSATGLPACTGCHSPNGNGNPAANFPRLSGQYPAYIEKTLGSFKTGERGNDMNGMMRAIAAKLSDQDMSAVADYVSTLKH